MILYWNKAHHYTYMYQDMSFVILTSSNISFTTKPLGEVDH